MPLIYVYVWCCVYVMYVVTLFASLLYTSLRFRRLFLPLTTFLGTKRSSTYFTIDGAKSIANGPSGKENTHSSRIHVRYPAVGLQLLLRFKVC